MNLWFRAQIHSSSANYKTIPVGPKSKSQHATSQFQLANLQKCLNYWLIFEVFRNLQSLYGLWLDCDNSLLPPLLFLFLVKLMDQIKYLNFAQSKWAQQHHQISSMIFSISVGHHNIKVCYNQTGQCRFKYPDFLDPKCLIIPNH